MAAASRRLMGKAVTCRCFGRRNRNTPAARSRPSTSTPATSDARIGCNGPQAETNLERLRRLCLARVSGRYEQTRFAQATARLDHELTIFDQLGRVSEFLAVVELAEFAQAEGIPLRLTGSGCSSIIPYLIGLSDVDPIRHRLFFERFRDPDGRWAPPFAIRVEEEQLDRISCVASLGYGEDLIEGTITFMPATNPERVPWLVAKLLQQDLSCTVDQGRIPLDDDQALGLIQRGDTAGMGVFHSDGLRSLLPRLRPGSTGELAAATTVYTLAIKRADLLEQYLQQGDGREFQGSETADILKVLAETRGLILYQEQVMMLLNRIGGICPADGFHFIKAAIKREAATVAGYRKQFVRTTVENGTDKKTAEGLFEQIIEAARYAACKANCVAEAMMNYQAAYLKAHHRPEFDRVLRDLRAST